MCIRFLLDIIAEKHADKVRVMTVGIFVNLSGSYINLNFVASIKLLSRIAPVPAARVAPIVATRRMTGT